MKNKEIKYAPIAGVRVISTNTRAAAELVVESVLESKPKAFHLVNAHSLSLTVNQGVYFELLRSSAWNFPDGKSITVFHRVVGNRVEQIRGPQLFRDVLRLSESKEVKHFLLGSTADVLFSLEKKIRIQFPNIKIVGSYSPPFTEPSGKELLARDREIKKSNANLVWVGLGTPKQDFEAERLQNSLGITAVPVGAAFDFLAGTKREAPLWVSKLGLEWLARLLTEPRRLWRRYLFGNALFLYLALKRFRQASGTKDI